MPSPVIQISHLTKRFPLRKTYWEVIRHPFRKKELTALQDVSLEIEKGELFGLLGPNGAGKTTLVKIMCTLILPNEGQVHINNLELVKNSAKIRKKIGYVISEERSFYWRLTGRENLDFFSTLNGMTNKLAKKRINEVLDIVKLGDDADRMFKDYSTGMRQKLAIARGLLSSPEILFMDEPTKSLDPAMAKRIRNFIKDELVNNGITVFLCTHNIQEALMCNRIGVINRSRLLACGTVEELGMEKAEREYNIVLADFYKDSMEMLIGSILKIPGVLKASERKQALGQTKKSEIRVSFKEESDIHVLMRYLTQQSIPVTSFYPLENSLEDVIDNILGNDEL